MPILTSEINAKVNAYKLLTPAEETKILSLKDDQKKVIIDGDKREKQSYLAAVPNINHPSIKSHPKFVAFTESVKASAH